MKAIIIIIIFAINSLAIAKDVDMSFSLNLGDTENLTYGETYPFSITIINNGPEDAGTETKADFPIAVFASNIKVRNGNVELVFFQETPDPNCIILTIIGHPPPGGGEIEYIYEIATNDLPANSTITCNGFYTVGFHSGNRNIEFLVSSGLDNDIDLSNNFQTVTFGIEPMVIPILNPWTIIFLSVLIFIIAIYYFNNKKEYE